MLYVDFQVSRNSLCFLYVYVMLSVDFAKLEILYIEFKDSCNLYIILYIMNPNTKNYEALKKAYGKRGSCGQDKPAPKLCLYGWLKVSKYELW